MNRFYVGQEVVCVKTHSKGYVNEGSHYTIMALSTGVCSCSSVIVDVGIKLQENHVSRCGVHRAYAPKNGNVWFSEKLFAPLQTQSEEADMNAALEEIMERELFV